jgi:putative Mn2+ efflux pump MntP
LFDRPCPGCGLTTSWTATIHGNLELAFRAHPLGPILYTLFTLSALLAFLGFWRGQRVVTDSRAFNRATAVGAIIFVAFGLWRMGTTTDFRTEEESFLAKFTVRQR